MVTYQFYLWDAIKGFELVGLLAERRRNQDRITDESIINWGRVKFGINMKAEEIYFVKVDLQEGEKRRFRIILNYSSCLLSIGNRQL
ncbi:MAG: hypothetical protein Q8P64_18565 [Deltaproteobacteria bacterium]|nr:hypothetical protein [Deltaproteobacteria bacterium]